MELNRKQDLSIYYWLKEVLPTFVTVVDGFPEDDLVLPTASVETLPIEGVPFELGGRDKDIRFWRIDIFADNKSQRDDMAYVVYKELEDNISVYNYDEGFPPDISPSKIGCMKCYDRRVAPIKVFEELVRKLYWRSAITFWTEYETI